MAAIAFLRASRVRNMLLHTRALIYNNRKPVVAVAAARQRHALAVAFRYDGNYEYYMGWLKWAMRVYAALGWVHICVCVWSKNATAGKWCVCVCVCAAHINASVRYLSALNAPTQTPNERLFGEVYVVSARVREAHSAKRIAESEMSVGNV